MIIKCNEKFLHSVWNFIFYMRASFCHCTIQPSTCRRHDCRCAANPSFRCRRDFVCARERVAVLIKRFIAIVKCCRMGISASSCWRVGRFSVFLGKLAGAFTFVWFFSDFFPRRWTRKNRVFFTPSVECETGIRVLPCPYPCASTLRTLHVYSYSHWLCLDEGGVFLQSIIPDYFVQKSYGSGSEKNRSL